MKIPLVLVTGFLGSGKTTFLRRIAESNPEWRLMFLVNEFSETSIDESILAKTGTPTQSIVGGSLFCECKAGDFIRVMRETVLAAHREQALDAVFIETSGTADPDAIGKLVQIHGLDEYFELCRIVSIVSPLRFKKLIRHLPVIENQILFSDLVIINKIDTASEDTLNSVESQIRLHNNDTEIVRAKMCRTPFSLTASLLRIPQGDLSTCDANPFATVSASWPKERSIDELYKWIEALPSSILRIKGEIQTPEGSWQVDKTVDTTEITPILQSNSSPSSRLVLIAHENHESILEKAIQWFQ